MPIISAAILHTEHFSPVDQQCRRFVALEGGRFIESTSPFAAPKKNCLVAILTQPACHLHERAEDHRPIIVSEFN
jgi:hypothetical protein